MSDGGDIPGVPGPARLREWLHCSVLDGFNRDNIQFALKERGTQYNSPMTGLLVIGYGNTLRKDDGVGPALAETVATLGLPGVEVLSCPLLTPELAAPISDAKVVLFINAAVNAP